MMSTVEMIVRVIITILVLLIMARLNGPKQISQMSFYDYVAGITVGSLAATVSTDGNLSLVNGLLAIILFLSASFFMGWLTNKSLMFRRLLTGKPIVLVQAGQIRWKGLKKARIDMNELLSNLRYGGYFDMNEVEDAILETTGKVSVRPKNSERPPKVRELKLSVPETPQITEIMIDGVLLRENMAKTGQDEKWLNKMLQSKGIKDNTEIALATLDSSGTLSVFKKEDKKQKGKP